MKFSYFLRGLGVGIVFAAIIMLIGSHSAGKTELTDEEIISKAKQLGLVEAGQSDADIDKLLDNVSEDAVKDTEETTTEGDAKDAEATTEEEVTTEKAADSTTAEEAKDDETTEASTTEEATTESKKADKAKKSKNKKSKKSKSSDKDVTFVISKGMYSEDLALLLQNYGVVDNAHKFNQYLCNNNNYAKRLKPGTYTVKQGTDYATIAAKVTY